jgi:hypothetical protein
VVSCRSLSEPGVNGVGLHRGIRSLITATLAFSQEVLLANIM